VPPPSANERAGFSPRGAAPNYRLQTIAFQDACVIKAIRRLQDATAGKSATSFPPVP